MFVRSGIRYDYVMYDKSDAFLNSLIKYHISGRLKVAPEHVSDRVLKLMGKPRHQLYDAFTARYAALNQKGGAGAVHCALFYEQPSRQRP